jgi:hypothetical protein
MKFDVGEPDIARAELYQLAILQPRGGAIVVQVLYVDQLQCFL